MPKPLLNKPKESEQHREAEWIVVGRFGRPQGLQSLVRVVSFTDPVENILAYTPWCVNIHGEWRPIDVISVEKHTRFILVQIEGYQQREDIVKLTNCEIGIKRDQLPTLAGNDYYWHDLIGMQVFNTDDVLLGTITEIMATGSNDVLVIAGEKRHLVPYIQDEFVLRIDMPNKVIVVNWDADF